MKVEIEVPDDVVEKIVNKFREWQPNDDEFEMAKREMWTPQEIVRAKAETLLRFYSERRVAIV